MIVYLYNNFLLVKSATIKTSPPALVLLEDEERYDVGPYLELLEDADSQWTINDIVSPSFSSSFSPVYASTLNRGITNTTIWLRFSLAGNPKPRQNILWLLELGWPFFDIESYLVRSQRDGRDGPPEKLTVDSHVDGVMGKGELVLRLPELAAEEQTIYLKLHADGVFFLYPVIRTAKNYLEASTHRMLWFGLYFGILLGLLFYNFFLFLCLGDRSYLWYVASIIAVGCYFFFINRLTYEYFLVNVDPRDMLRAIMAFMVISMITLVLFARCFLQTWHRAVLLDKLILFFLGLLVVILLLVPFAGMTLLNHLLTAAGGLLWLLLMPAAINCWRRGYRPARFLVFSWAVYGVGTVCFGLTFQGILPFCSLSIHSLQIGSAIETILLSFALADRINLLRREREELSHSDRRNRELAVTDGLTGLYNLRYFKAQIDVELEMADRSEQKLTLMMMDVDYFKVFNDRFGHQEGDRVLTALGKIMTSCIREKDVPCRYGGEEFAIILPGGQNSTAIEIYERINLDLSEYGFGPERERGLVTLSIGVAEHIPGEQAENLVLRADQALYEAKARGRNQIVIASREPKAIFFNCFKEPVTVETGMRSPLESDC